MVYGAISKLGKVCIVIKQGSYNSSFHCELLEQQVLPIAIELFPNGFVLQQDNAPVHTSSITQTFIDQNQIATVSWPPYSPDLNIIENIWWIMKAEVEKSSPSNIQQLETAILAAWDNLQTNTIVNLYNSIINRLQLCIAKGGSKVPY